MRYRKRLFELTVVLSLLAFCSTGNATGDERGASLFPLEVGNRWIYQRNTGHPMEMRVVRCEELDGRSLFVVYFGWDERGFSHESLYEEKDGNLYLCAQRHFDKLVKYDVPVFLLPASVSQVLSWRSPTTTQSQSSEKDAGRFFDATVVGSELVQVEAGEFLTWKIHYVEIGNRKLKYDTQIWFAPGVGIVRMQQQLVFDHIDESRQPAPDIFELSRFERVPLETCVDQIEHPLEVQICAHFKVLRDGNDSEAATAIQDLKALGNSVIPILFLVQSEVDSGPFRSRVDNLLGQFGKLAFTGFARKETCKVGETLPVEFRLRNDYPIPVNVLPQLELSDRGRDPKYKIEIRRQDGSLVDVPLPQLMCGNFAHLSEENFILMKPGYEIDPLGWPLPYDARERPNGLIDGANAYDRHHVLRWQTTETGTFSIRCIYDTNLRPFDTRWFRDFSADQSKLTRLLQESPHGRFESNIVTVTVEP